jgi:hypothetical protein
VPIFTTSSRPRPAPARGHSLGAKQAPSECAQSFAAAHEQARSHPQLMWTPQCSATAHEQARSHPQLMWTPHVQGRQLQAPRSKSHSDVTRSHIAKSSLWASGLHSAFRFVHSMQRLPCCIDWCILFVDIKSGWDA